MLKVFTRFQFSMSSLITYLTVLTCRNLSASLINLALHKLLSLDKRPFFVAYHR